jgi:hypothetical protein
MQRQRHGIGDSVEDLLEIFERSEEPDNTPQAQQPQQLGFRQFKAV